MGNQTLTEIKTAKLFPSESNRADLGNGDLKELSASIEQQGVLVPLIVREMGADGTYEIVAGHRRHKAAVMAKLETVPCLVMDLSDHSAATVQVVENLHRKDLNPVEEAEAFELMMEQCKGCTVADVAGMANKSPKYVHRALELLKLPAAAKTALRKGVITAAHGHQLARVGPKQIEEMVAYAITPGYNREVPSLESLKAEIGRRVEKDLESSPFPKDKEYAGKVSCVQCPSNSANQGVLFDGAAAGRCTNGTCFSAKIAQFYRDLEADGKKKWPRLKYIGAASATYGDNQVIKGHVVVEEKDPKIKKAMADTKDGFAINMGFGILKPSAWSKQKRPRLVVLRKQQPSEEKPDHNSKEAQAQRCKENTIEKWVAQENAKAVFAMGALTTEAAYNIGDLVADHSWLLHENLKWIAAAGIIVDVKAKGFAGELKKALRKLPASTIVAFAFWVMADALCGDSEETLMKIVGVNANEIRKQSLKKAQQKWETHKDAILKENNIQ